MSPVDHREHRLNITLNGLMLRVRGTELEKSIFNTGTKKPLFVFLFLMHEFLYKS